MNSKVEHTVTFNKVRISSWNEGDEFPYNVSGYSNLLKQNSTSVAILKEYANYPELLSPFFAAYFNDSATNATLNVNTTLTKAAAINKQTFENLSLDDVKSRYCRLTHHYRCHVVEGKNYIYRDLLTSANKYLFHNEFALFLTSRQRTAEKYGIEPDKFSMTLEKYLEEVNVLRAESNLPPMRSKAPTIHLASQFGQIPPNDDPPIQSDFMSMEQAMDVPFDHVPENDENETVKNLEDDQNSQIVIGDDDATFLRQYLSLDEDKKNELRATVSNLANPRVVVQKNPYL